MKYSKSNVRDAVWMLRAIQLAEGGRGVVEPNPMVGAIVLDAKGCLLGEGYHGSFGGPHAEVEALKKVKNKARMKGGTLYVTLEPCSTHGKTPPCTDLIKTSGIKRVVVGAIDPNPKHRGKGIKLLERSGIKVECGVLSEVVEKQNIRFFKFMKKGRPFVTLKLAQSLDGKIATAKGESKWITSKESRERVHALRREHEAILVGTNTLKSDLPGLQVRLKGKEKNLRRIFVVRKPNQLKKYLIIQDKKDDILFYESAFSYRLKNMKQIKAPFNAKGVNLSFLMNALRNEGVSSLLVEGGGEMAASFLEGKWVDQVYFFVAPIVIGGRAAKTSIEGKGIEKLHAALKVKNTNLEKIGQDILIHGEL